MATVVPIVGEIYMLHPGRNEVIDKLASAVDTGDWFIEEIINNHDGTDVIGARVTSITYPHIGFGIGLDHFATNESDLRAFVYTGTRLPINPSNNTANKGSTSMTSPMNYNSWDLYDAVIKSSSIKRILIYGPPAVGKTHKAAQYFSANDIPFEMMTCTEGDMVTDYRGMYIPNGDVFEWFNGLLIRGWTHNGVGMPIILNEIDKLPLEVHALLHGILDNPDIARITLPNHEPVRPGPNFRLIGTMNGVPADLSDALVSRFQVKIEINTPHDSAFEALPEFIRHFARNVIAKRENSAGRQFNYRQFQAFAESYEELGTELAAAAVWGRELGTEVLNTMKLASSPAS